MYNSNQDQKNDPSINENEAEALRLAAAAKKRRTLVIWIRVVALIFAGLFLLSQCGMSKPRAKAAIIQSCVDNVPNVKRWQDSLRDKGLQDSNHQLVKQYCICMWDEPLQKLGQKQIESFASASTQEQLRLLGGAQAFEQRDQQCLSNLVKYKNP